MRGWWVPWCLVVACGGGGSDTPMDAAIDAARPCTHQPDLRLLEMRATKYGSMGSGGYEGMICVEGRGDLGCATVTAGTKFSLCVPATGDFALRMTKTGYETVLVPMGQGIVLPQYGIEAGNDAFVNAQYWSPIGGTYPPTTQGLLNFVVVKVDAQDLPSALGGAQIQVTPVSTVVYVNDMAMPDMTATATNDMVSVALVANLAPGPIDVKITSATHPNCTLGYGGGNTSPVADHQLRVPIVAGATTSVLVQCKQ